MDILRSYKSSRKSFHSLGHLVPNRYELDLPNEVIYIYFGQGVAKISEVKVGGKKISWAQAHRYQTGLRGKFFFRPPNLTFDIFAVL